MFIPDLRMLVFGALLKTTRYGAALHKRSEYREIKSRTKIDDLIAEKNNLPPLTPFERWLMEPCIARMERSRVSMLDKLLREFQSEHVRHGSRN